MDNSARRPSQDSISRQAGDPLARPEWEQSPEYIGYLAACLTPRRLHRLDQVLAGRTRHVVLVLENIYHPHNASACLRSCDAFGVQEVHTVEDRNPFDPHPEIALGSAQWLDLIPHEGTGAIAYCVERLRKRGYRIVATSARPDARPLDSCDVTQRTALLFGNEHDGLSATALELADEHVTIPTYGFTDSLNISVAVAVCLHHLTWRMRAQDVDWRLDVDDRQRLLGEWIRRAIGPRRLEFLTRRFLAERAR